MNAFAPVTAVSFLPTCARPMNSLLSIAFVYLFSAVVAVPISKRLGLGSAWAT